MREALTEVLTERGTANSARLPDVVAAGKTGTAQNTRSDLAHAWFVGFAPAHDPKIVVAVMVEFGDHGYTAARYATAIMAKYLNVRPPVIMQNLPPIVAGARAAGDTTRPAPRPAAD